jgi:uncharacterized protein YpiB (UPF0302 family)
MLFVRNYYLNNLKIASIINKKTRSCLPLKNYYLNPPQQPEVSALDELFAEMVLETALLQFQKRKILQEIDLALKDNNKDDFLRLTEELIKFEN